MKTFTPRFTAFLILALVFGLIGAVSACLSQPAGSTLQPFNSSTLQPSNPSAATPLAAIRMVNLDRTVNRLRDLAATHRRTAQLIPESAREFIIRAETLEAAADTLARDFLGSPDQIILHLSGVP